MRCEKRLEGRKGPHTILRTPPECNHLRRHYSHHVDVCARRKPTSHASMVVWAKTAGETDGLCLRLRASGRGGFHLLLMVQPRAKRTRQRFALKTEQYAYSPGVRQIRIRTRDESAESKTGMPTTKKKKRGLYPKKRELSFSKWEGVGGGGRTR